MGLIFVPTPLGNRGDITLRALETLRTCDLLVAEDTRTARRLFALYDLALPPLLSYREQNAGAVTMAILERARQASVAVVSDAGMPAISDPGRDLIRAARCSGIAVDVLPGPSAFVCAAVLSGFPLMPFSFHGFVPRAAGDRRRTLAAAVAARTTSVWYEAPTRIVATLDALDGLAPNLAIFVVRELSKRFEQQVLGKAREIRSAFTSPVRGEITLVIGAASDEAETSSPQEHDVADAISAALAQGAGTANAAKLIAKRFGLKRGDIYRRIAEGRTNGEKTP